MLHGFKIRIHPSKEQVSKFYQYAGTSRHIYNWSLATINDALANGVKFSQIKLSNQLTVMQQEVEDKKWLQKIPNRVKQMAIENCQDAFKRYFAKISKHPRTKRRKDGIKFNFSSAVNKPNKGKIVVPLIGDVGLNKSDKLTAEINGKKFINRLKVLFDGKYWYLTGAYEKEAELYELSKESIGIDLGLKDLAILSNGIKYKNINKTHKVKKIAKRLKRVQRSLSRKYEMNKDGNKNIVTKNISKQLVQLKLLHRRLADIRCNHIEHITTEIAKTKPSRVVMEDLNVSGMMKNRHLARSIGEASWKFFRTKMEWKCKKFGIEFVLADRFYASSKTCSACGAKKKDLTLRDRIYSCACGSMLDRDVNAAINLSNYVVLN